MGKTVQTVVLSKYADVQANESTENTPCKTLDRTSYFETPTRRVETVGVNVSEVGHWSQMRCRSSSSGRWRVGVGHTGGKKKGVGRPEWDMEPATSGQKDVGAGRQSRPRSGPRSRWRKSVTVSTDLRQGPHQDTTVGLGVMEVYTDMNLCQLYPSIPTWD